MSLPILILAAGASRRMRGKDKLLEPIDGESLLRRTVRTACTTGHPVTVALPVAPHPRHDCIDDLNVDRLEVPDAAEGINATLRAGIKHLAAAEAIMIVLADLPDITSEHLARVFAAKAEAPMAKVWRGTTQTGGPGHPTLIDKDLFSALCALTGDGGAQPVLRDAPTHLVPLSGDAARHDLDTPEDWARWRENSDR